jgi:glycerol kinase
MTIPAVVAIDQGTTGSKACRLDTSGKLEPLGGLQHRQILPQPGWVEHDANELLDHVRQLATRAGDAVALGLDNQGETVVAWDADSGKPVYNAIVWQDARTLDVTAKLKAGGAECLTIARAGLPLDPYFSASKLRWIIDHVARAKSLLDRGKLRLGTSDSFFLDRLAGVYATDVTTASRTSLMNLDTGQWDPELCRLFGVPLEALPEIRPTAGSFGTTGKLAIAASICDQQAALFGHGCRRAGQAKITFGTGAFALAVADSNIAADRAAGMTRTAAWKIGNGPIAYAIEGGAYDAASAINWARGLELFQEYAEIDDFAAPPAIERGIVFVPALSGLAAPYWDRNAAGMWLGLGLDSTKSDMMQSMLEGIALLASEVIDTMHKATPLAGAISIDGGLSNNRYFCRFLARALGRPVAVPGSADLTVLGAAQLAMIGAGLCDIDSLPAAPAERRRESGEPPLPAQMRERFRSAAERCRNWR